MVFDDFAGISHGNCIRRNIAHYHRTGTDGNIVADCHTWQDGDTAANPDVIADRDGLGPLLTTFAFHRVGAVASYTSPVSIFSFSVIIGFIVNDLDCKALL